MNIGLISVIVPIFNIEQFLPKCIESILNQTYPKLEVLLINDGSTDGSLAICTHYAAKDERIRIVTKENGGLSDARNYGINMATGEYLFFVDGDDYIHPCACEVLLGNLLQANADISIGNFQKVQDLTIVQMGQPRQCFTKYTGRESCFNLYNELGVIFTTAWGKLYKTIVFKDIRYPKGKIHEDEFIAYQLLYFSNTVVYTEEILYFYVQREDSIIHRKYDEKNLVMLEMAEQTICFFQKRKEIELERLAVERALGLGKMLYDKYDNSQKKCRKIVIKKYKMFLKKYGKFISVRTKLKRYLYAAAPWAEKESGAVIDYIFRIKDAIFMKKKN